MEIWDYLKGNILPDEHVSAERIVQVAKRYTLRGSLPAWHQRRPNAVHNLRRWL
jgi:hypothetical protein